MRILVTGGAGFIGSNLVRVLLDETRWRVRVLDKLTYSGNLANFPQRFWKDRRFEFVRGDVKNRTIVKDVLRGVDAIVHCAAETHIDRSNVSVRPFVLTDFVGTWAMLDEFRRNPCERFVHISTCEVYGTAQKVPMAEDHQLVPLSPYAATKAGADRLCNSYVETFGLPIVILRPFNQYGPHQYPEKVIPFFVTRALRGEPLYVYGSGNNTRDWTFVSDFCELVMRVLTVRRSKVEGEVFNVGSGEEKSVLDIGRMVLEMLGKPRNLLVHVKDRPGHVRRLVCDTRKSRQILGWTAKTHFERGLRQTVAWYRENSDWWKEIVRGRPYRQFFRRWYAETLGVEQEDPRRRV